MQMNIKKPKGLLKDSIIIMDFMSGEDKMYYLERMWDLYFKVLRFLITKLRNHLAEKKFQA